MLIGVLALVRADELQPVAARSTLINESAEAVM